MERTHRESILAMDTYKMMDNCREMISELNSDLNDTFLPLRDVRTPPPIETLKCMPGVSIKRKSGDDGSPSKRTAIALDDAQTGVANLNIQDKTLAVKSEDPVDSPCLQLPETPLELGMEVYAMRNSSGPWFKARILEIMPKDLISSNFTSCRLKFDHQNENDGVTLPARCIAYASPHDEVMAIGTRLIALVNINNHQNYYPGVVAESPSNSNIYRYLVFFDDGYSDYVKHNSTRLVCEHSANVWEEVLPISRDFIRNYLHTYPSRPMVRLLRGQRVKTEWDGKWWPALVAQVDSSIALLIFSEGHQEWIYRGSPRLLPLYEELQPVETFRQRPRLKTKGYQYNVQPYVEYTRVDELTNKEQNINPTSDVKTIQVKSQKTQQNSVRCKKSTTTTALSLHCLQNGAPKSNSDSVDTAKNKIVYYTPKNAVRPHRLTPHACSTTCRRSDVLSLADLRTYNPLAKPLLSGWERQIVRFKGQKDVMYRAPCGRRLRNMRELHRYLRLTDSELAIDLFDFQPGVRSFTVLQACDVMVKKKDLSKGSENIRIPCVNNYETSLPGVFLYRTDRSPTPGVPLNLDPGFLCGCDCLDDCEDKSKCACWKMTLEGARTIGMDTSRVGYEYKRLPDPLPSGIYECNSRCKCKQTCLNRVAQHPLQLKLQVFKTLNCGWGVRTLHDIPKGTFICVYAGKLLTDATANQEGLSEGDGYLAALDYIEVLEQMKEGYEEDVPGVGRVFEEEDSTPSSEELSLSSDEEYISRTDLNCEQENITNGLAFKTQYSEEEIRRELLETQEKEFEMTKTDDDVITSDCEKARIPSSFTPKDGVCGNELKPTHKSVRTLFDEQEAYVMDARTQGNVGRYFNHSCSPNVFVQNVFVDTHDLRFPCVAFFALSLIKAGRELTWDYNYVVGSVPGKVLDCNCGAPNCRGRLL